MSSPPPARKQPSPAAKAGLTKSTKCIKFTSMMLTEKGEVVLFDKAQEDSLQASDLLPTQGTTALLWKCGVPELIELDAKGVIVRILKTRAHEVKEDGTLLHPLANDWYQEHKRAQAKTATADDKDSSSDGEVTVLDLQEDSDESENDDLATQPGRPDVVPSTIDLAGGPRRVQRRHSDPATPKRQKGEPEVAAPAPAKGGSVQLIVNATFQPEGLTRDYCPEMAELISKNPLAVLDRKSKDWENTVNAKLDVNNAEMVRLYDRRLKQKGLPGVRGDGLVPQGMTEADTLAILKSVLMAKISKNRASFWDICLLQQARSYSVFHNCYHGGFSANARTKFESIINQPLTIWSDWYERNTKTAPPLNIEFKIRGTDEERDPEIVDAAKKADKKREEELCKLTWYDRRTRFKRINEDLKRGSR